MVTSDPRSLLLRKSKTAMSNTNGLMRQKSCHCLDQGRTMNDILMRAAHWLASKPNCSSNRCDKVALKTTCIKNVKFKIIKIRTGCQDVGYLYYSKNLNWSTKNRRLGRGLDIAGLKQTVERADSGLLKFAGIMWGLWKTLSLRDRCQYFCITQTTCKRNSQENGTMHIKLTDKKMGIAQGWRNARKYLHFCKIKSYRNLPFLNHNSGNLKLINRGWRINNLGFPTRRARQ